MPLVICEGCSAHIKYSGLYPHLQLSHDPKCKEYLEKLTHWTVDTPVPTSKSELAHNSPDNDKDLLPFPMTDDLVVDPAGDLFGDYVTYGVNHIEMEAVGDMNLEENNIQGDNRAKELEDRAKELEDAAFEATLAEEEDGLEPERKPRYCATVEDEVEEPDLPKQTRAT